ncbi:MAG TPA: SatD family protein [Solirubrobacterales bacterium]
MSKMVYATLIGDLIGSRQAQSRVDLQFSLRRALDSANAFLEPVQPLEPTVGDEFQGAFRDPVVACEASLLLRLLLLKDGGVDVRFGLGFGEVTVFESRTPISQDGPGWWSARAAIEHVADLARAGRTDFVRTYLASSEVGGLPGGEVGALNAYLLCRDGLVAQMKPRGHRLLLGTILGRSQAELAKEEGISQPAVSQNLAAGGVYPIEVAGLELEREGRLS